MSISKLRKLCLCAVVFTLSPGLIPLANAQTYSFTDLGALTVGGNSWANGINNAGQVVGSSTTTGSANYATLWNGTTATALGSLSGVTTSYAKAINDSGQVVGYSASSSGVQATLWNGTTATGLTGGSNAIATAINNAGQIVGYSDPARASSQAILWNGGTMSNLGTAGGTISLAAGINKAGQIAGSYQGHATLWNGTTATDLGTLGASLSEAYAINNAGQIVGLANVPASAWYHATLWNGTAITDLGTLLIGGGGYSQANALNNAGQIVGLSYVEGRNIGTHATLWNWNGTGITDLNSLLDPAAVSAGWELSSASGINDKGWIVGSAFNTHTGVTHAFLLSPVPEPETYAMMLAGLGLMVFAARRRKQQAA